MKKKSSLRLDGYIALIAGVAIIIFPLKVFTGIAVIVGVVLIIAGVRRILQKISERSARVLNSVFMMLIGVAFLGAAFAWFPVTIDPSDVLGYLIGLMLVYNGARRVFRYRRVKTPMNESLASAGWVAIISGLIIALVPFVSDAIIVIFTVLLGLILIGYGVLRLFIRMNVVDRYQEFKNEYDKNDAIKDDQDVIDVD